MQAFDSLEYVKALRAVGVPEAQAEVHAKTFKQILESDLATKGDMANTQREIKELDVKLKELEVKLEAKIETTKAELKRDIETLHLHVQKEMAELKAELIKWMIGLLFAQTGVLIAAYKLLSH